jgi:hypothetical protein
MSSLRGEPPLCFIAPLHAAVAASEETWIALAGEHVRWSPDGNQLYITSEQDGFPCLYVQRLDSRSKRPVGPLQAIHHFDIASRSVIEDPAWRGPSIARDKIVISLVELTGNIWMAESQSRLRN